MIFSAYRRDDFADPEGFMLQLGMVLERYSDNVIRAVSDPRTGIQRRCKFPPSIAEVVEACDAEVTAADTRARYAAMPSPRPLALLFGPREPQNRGNVLVGPMAPQYPDMLERTKTAAPLDWRRDEHGRGIWVPISWFDETPTKSMPRRFTIDELKEIYAAREPAPPHQDAAE